MYEVFQISLGRYLNRIGTGSFLLLVIIADSTKIIKAVGSK